MYIFRNLCLGLQIDTEIEDKVLSVPQPVTNDNVRGNPTEEESPAGKQKEKKTRYSRTLMII